MKLRSRTLEVTLLLITLLTKPRSWVLLGVFYICLGAYKETSKISWFYVENWQSILAGMANADVLIHEKLFVIGVFFLFAAVALMFISVAMRIVIQRFVRFGTKPEL